MSKKKRPPSDAGRKTLRVQITMLPDELKQLDQLAKKLARPGYPSNRSEAVRLALHAVLHAEADGKARLEPGRIRCTRE